MIERAYIHVTGPEGSGKTTLVARDAELRRYREAGASGAARFAFPAEEEDGDGFFCSNVMSDYSKAVLIEGDCPVDYVDLEVFVAPPLAAGSALLRKTKRRKPAVAASAVEEILLGVGRRPAIASFAGSRAREVIGKLAVLHGANFGPQRGRARPLGAGAKSPRSGARRPRRRQRPRA